MAIDPAGPAPKDPKDSKDPRRAPRPRGSQGPQATPRSPRPPASASRTGRNLPVAIGVGAVLGGLVFLTLLTVKATFLLYVGAAIGWP